MTRTTLFNNLKTMSGIPKAFVKRLVGIKGYKHGGTVKKTGLAYLHKGEMVVPRPKVSKSMIKKMGLK